MSEGGSGAEARGKRQEARGKRQEARGKRQEARGKRQEARGKRQEARGKRQEARKGPGIAAGASREGGSVTQKASGVMVNDALIMAVAMHHPL
jgi:hypothetical protein